ncbi:hypothetical protein DFH08DRAFT_828342 [Mycena albidolilacea]|uniref:Uncharacterized protein n=1 Tax=Mycena albidolilacea TaxID=1033008 RepID=A0AAD7E705_9AGAR|nr:hypothetical protein DFH08DRAFT_828342 [Mycena albidolilacea]
MPIRENASTASIIARGPGGAVVMGARLRRIGIRRAVPDLEADEEEGGANVGPVVARGLSGAVVMGARFGRVGVRASASEILVVLKRQSELPGTSECREQRPHVREDQFFEMRRAPLLMIQQILREILNIRQSRMYSLVYTPFLVPLVTTYNLPPLEQKETTFSTPNMVDTNGALMFVSLGIDVQIMQISLAADTRKNDLALDLDLELYESLAEWNEHILYERRTELNERFQTFRHLQTVYMPNLRAVLTPLKHQHMDSDVYWRAETAVLFLPFEITNKAQQERACIGGLWDIEIDLTEQQHLILHASCQLEDAKHRKQEAEAALKSLQGYVPRVVGTVPAMLDAPPQPVKKGVLHTNDALTMGESVGMPEEVERILKSLEVD